MKRILVPLDGSKFAERALEPALHLADRNNAELHLISVVSDIPPVPLASTEGDLISRWFQEEEARAEHYLTQTKQSLDGKAAGATVHTHVRVGPVTRSLEELGETLSADLIMLTTHGRGAWQRAWLGSVADQLLRRSMIPLCLLRDQAGDQKPFGDEGYPRHILVPLDGSPAAETVLEVLAKVVAPRGSRVTLASVLHQPFPLATTYLPHAVSDEGLVQERKAATQAYLDEVEKRVAGIKGADVDTRMVVGEDAARSLLEFAEKESVDLIALSTRGRGGMTRFFLGSVADKLVRGAKVPLLTVRRAAEADEAEEED